MIAHLRGVLEEKGADRVVVDVDGVGYLVQVSLQTLAALPRTGDEVRLLIHAHQSPDAPLMLFGFATGEERQLFELLIGVHGVGPKLAQQVLGGMEGGELAAAIAAGNSARLRTIKGVGPKTAERIVLELRGKVHPPARGGAAAAAGPAAALGSSALPPDVIAALVGLGYKAVEAEQAVRAAAARAPDAPPDRLLREALRQIHKLGQLAAR